MQRKQKKIKKAADQDPLPKRRVALVGGCNFIYKPGSVVNGHQSSLTVTDKLRGLPRATCGYVSGKHPTTVLLRIGFTAPLCYHRSG